MNKWLSVIPSKIRAGRSLMFVRNNSSAKRSSPAKSPGLMDDNVQFNEKRLAADSHFAADDLCAKRSAADMLAVCPAAHPKLEAAS